MFTIICNDLSRGKWSKRAKIDLLYTGIVAFSGNNMSAYKNKEETKMTDTENSNSKRNKFNRLKANYTKY